MEKQRNIYYELLIETQMYIKVFICVVNSRVFGVRCGFR